MPYAVTHNPFTVRHVMCRYIRKIRRICIQYANTQTPPHVRSTPVYVPMVPPAFPIMCTYMAYMQINIDPNRNIQHT